MSLLVSTGLRINEEFTRLLNFINSLQLSCRLPVLHLKRHRGLKLGFIVYKARRISCVTQVICILFNFNFDLFVCLCVHRRTKFSGPGKFHNLGLGQYFDGCGRKPCPLVSSAKHGFISINSSNYTLKFRPQNSKLINFQFVLDGIYFYLPTL